MEEPIFEVSKLTDYELGHLEYIVNSPSWERVFKPFLERAHQMYSSLLQDPNPETRERFGGDEYLRCGANNVKKQLEFYEKIIAETQHARVMAAREQIGQEDLYIEAVRSGIIGPAGKTALNDGYPPDEEF